MEFCYKDEWVEVPAKAVRLITLAAQAIERERIATLIEEDCISNGHYDNSTVHWESDYQLCEDCKYIINKVRG